MNRKLVDYILWGKRISVFIILLFVSGILIGAALPNKAYISKEDNYMDVYADNVCVDPANGFYDVAYETQPLLTGPPDLPPDPGQTVPIGDYIPLLLFGMLYGIIKMRKINFLLIYSKERG